MEKLQRTYHPDVFLVEKNMRRNGKKVLMKSLALDFFLSIDKNDIN